MAGPPSPNIVAKVAHLVAGPPKAVAGGPPKALALGVPPAKAAHVGVPAKAAVAGPPKAVALGPPPPVKAAPVGSQGKVGHGKVPCAKSVWKAKPSGAKVSMAWADNIQWPVTVELHRYLFEPNHLSTNEPADRTVTQGIRILSSRNVSVQRKANFIIGEAQGWPLLMQRIRERQMEAHTAKVHAAANERKRQREAEARAKETPKARVARIDARLKADDDRAVRQLLARTKAAALLNQANMAKAAALAAPQPLGREAAAAAPASVPAAVSAAAHVIPLPDIDHDDDVASQDPDDIMPGEDESDIDNVM